MKVWRDVDSPTKKLGVVLWRTGGEVRLGLRLFRWRYFR